MGATETINAIKAEIADISIQDCDEVLDKILKAKTVLFFDTGFFEKAAKYSKRAKIIEIIKRMEADITGITIVMSELVLYELRSVDGLGLNPVDADFLKALYDEGFCITILSEENLCDSMDKYIKRSATEKNSQLVKFIYDNKANLTKLCGVIIRDGDFPYIGMLENGYKVPREPNYVAEVISAIIRRKQDRDSLAEELITLALLFLLELPGRTRYMFCTNDYAAITRFNKAMQTSAGSNESRAACVSFLSFVQYAIQEKIFLNEDKQDILRLLRCSVGEEVLVLRDDKLPIHKTWVTLSIESAAERLLNGERFLDMTHKK
ncbi:hypothetical protein SAMN04487770_12212 [Butyrivibrio sp. ob235]|uniref:hypothetical protein n=1 Tax=Butyrivibrio sp. ob235 TaxID=1761780 RepID=UPI0008BCC1AD|nr:hypothetical protein [Butyrivibrio sp. ob235]SEL96351.1 hypothetical protein SAMN04487770_12212 [Butyrivibrio sp. ob235]